MSTPAAPVVSVKKSAIQVIEEEIIGFIRQREQAIQQVHIVDGAIQGAQHLLAKLKAEAVKAEVEAKAIGEKVEAKVVSIEQAVAKDIDTAVTEVKEKL